MDAAGSTLRVLYDFEYEDREKRKIAIKRGEKLFLLCKTNNDWWQVIKNSSERPFFVPVPYVTENCDESLHPDHESEGQRLSDGGAKSVSKPYGTTTATIKDLYASSPCYEVQKTRQNYSHSSDENEFHILDDEFEGVSDSDYKLEGKKPFIGYSQIDSRESGEKRSCETIYANIHYNPHTLPRGNENKHIQEHRVSPPHPPILSLKPLNMGSDNESSFSNCQSKENCGVIRKNKLTKSRSFKTRSELQKISRVEASPIFLLPHKSSDLGQEKSIDSVSAVKESEKVSVINEIGPLANETLNSQMRVPLTFRNELYSLSNVPESDINKTSDSGNISSESLYTHEEDISDSGASHKSGLVSSAQSRESIQEHSDVPGDDTSKEELESSREDLWTTDLIEDVPIPDGWRLAVDEKSGEQCYLNDATNVKWFSSTDGKGRVYYFEENSNVSSWTLPNIVVANDEEAGTENDQLAEVRNVSLRSQEGEKKSRVLKTRSMFNDQRHKETSSKSSSIPRNWLQLYGLDEDVLKHGNMNRTKITENGKKMSKKWASAYVVLTDDALCFYKDHKNSHHSVGLQPELSMQLSGARVESGEKLSSRKHVFLVTSGSLQLLCECENAELALLWRQAIGNAITKLTLSSSTPPLKTSSDKPKAVSIGRSKSLQVKNRDISSIDDATSTEEQQMKIRDRLKKFFNRRPTREILASKGIYKDEPVFDSRLEKVCPSHPPYIPEFVKRCINVIESREENMKTDGLYRASGNLSHVQKIRLQVDQNNLSVLESEEDVHVLTGALKLFFRELKEPLIPYELFNKAIDAGGMNGSKREKIKIFREIVKQLPHPNHDTLQFLLNHLRNVTKYQEFNRMQIPNLAIVFGPTLMWREKEFNHNIAIEYMQQNLVIEFFLQQFDDIFR